MYSSRVFRLEHSLHQKVQSFQFREFNVIVFDKILRRRGAIILSYKERYIQKVLSISTLLDECCFVFKYGFLDCPNFYIKCSIEIWGVIIISWTWICKRTIFLKLFVFSALPDERLTVVLIWFRDRRTLLIQC